VTISWRVRTRGLRCHSLSSLCMFVPHCRCPTVWWQRMQERGSPLPCGPPCGGVNSLDNGSMTGTAGALCDRLAPCLHLNWLMEIACGKGVRVPKAVIGLGIILRDDVCRCMAIITRGHEAVTRFDPRVYEYLCL
jgi:hypothetical protein